MSYVFMKALEKKAEKYDRGIKLLTLGKLPKIKKWIVEKYLTSADQILDIGMGTGTFAVLAASMKKVNVVGIDQSEKMLVVANRHINEANVQEYVHPMHLAAVEIDSKFLNESFDKVIAILSLSEMYRSEQDYCFKQIYRVLKAEGQFIIVDETIPEKWWKKILYFTIRVPLVFLTYLFTNLSTKSLKNINHRLLESNFIIIDEKKYLLETLSLIRVKKQ
ncbi:corrinoid protein-associated methyltransferase CpaM [Promethearchaeum syntrophicum]|uniref:Corrinoid protein-associated methyltransferase CpaM n=1 Tax=Promethearchaeum syntrophicum TaxID=2594042 RepID=A0A5B9DDE4_9ARCH|nr:corrinoid protein-associated methyltransferase CpaM [Candidatus Prometheoarchaeum syntrophicum]QEE16897.1 ubiquinone/menaquinone biosynthesis methyltransferase [Candidatus Prometheoarchaeum syntrophicum]